MKLLRSMMYKIFKKKIMSIKMKNEREIVSKTEDTIKSSIGFNQETWNKVEKMLEIERSYYQTNRRKIAEKIYSKYNGKNEYNLYKDEIVIAERKIDGFEKECELNSSCQVGCSACCYQLIGINPIEKAVLRKAVYKLSVGERERIKAKAEQIVDKLKEINFCISHKTIEEGDYIKEQLLQYLNLQLKCPLLSEGNKCMIYETRPFACWSYRNYGRREDCANNIPIHSCAFNDAGLPILDAFGTINYGKTDLNDYEILPVYLTEIL